MTPNRFDFCTGVDILRVKRLEESLENPRFLTRVYGSSELELWETRRKNPLFLAGNFCAKEAFSKALGTGIRGFALSEVEVLRDELGKPYFRLSGNAARIVSEKNLAFDVSISHEGDYAVAFVVAWQS